jgi:hypothetical protein
VDAVQDAAGDLVAVERHEPQGHVRVGIAEPPVNIANGAVIVTGVAERTAVMAKAGNW